MRRFLFLLGCLALLGGQVAAQNRTITGKVLDSAGASIAGATVVVKGSNRGTSTGGDGSFSLSVPANARTIVVTAVNFTPTEISIQNRTDVGSITMHQGSTSLNEVVVVAYGVQKKTNVTGAITTVNAAQVADRPFTSVDKALQGDVAGLQVTSTSGAPGSATDIRLRGIGSITADAGPLWVIDGVIATTGDLTSNTTTANALSSLNPDDIESISVLKDAASTSIYGSKGANGVILVTTKKGRQGKTRFTATAEIGQNSRAFDPTNKPMNSVQAQTAFRQAVINAKEATDNASADAFIANNYGTIPNYTSVNTNWLDVVSQNGNQSQYNLSMQGGNEKTQFYASGGYFHQVGTTIATDFTRYNGDISVTHKASDRFTFSANLNIGSSLQNTPSNGGTFANPVLASYFLLPWYTPRMPDGSLRFGDKDTLNEFPTNGGTFNPLVQAAYNKNPFRQTTVRGSFSGEVKILNNLKFTSRYAAEYFDVSEDQYRNPFYGDGQAQGGDAFSSYRRVFDWTWSNFFDFKQNINREGDIYFNLKGGYEAYQVNNYILQAGGQAFPKTLLLTTLASTATPTTATANPSDKTTASEFAIGDISYKDRYILSGSFRRDGSSVFGANYLYGNFWSVGASWNLNEEDFIKNSLPVFNLLKLRASYGSNGNENGFGYYNAIATYGYGFNYHGQPGSAPTNPGNPNLTWELNKPFNIGLDFGLLKDRITGTVEYYYRKTDHLLLNVPLSYTTGVINPATNGPTQLENAAAMTNKGIEVTVGGRPVVTRDFSWSISFNIAHNINTVTQTYLHNPIASANGNFRYEEGHPLLSYFLRQWAGVNPADGTPQWYTDSSRKATTGSYTAAKQALNFSAMPTVYGALSNTFTYKFISLDIQFNYNFGNYLYDTWGSYLNSDGFFYGSVNQMTRQLGAWQKPGDKTDVPQLIDGGNNNSYRGSTRYLYKGDFIRLRNLQLSYNMPANIASGMHLGSLSVYIRGTNLLTFDTDKNLPYDPESGIFSRTNLDVYIPKTFAGGVKIGF